MYWNLASLPKPNGSTCVISFSLFTLSLFASLDYINYVCGFIQLAQL